MKENTNNSAENRRNTNITPPPPAASTAGPYSHMILEKFNFLYTQNEFYFMTISMFRDQTGPGFCLKFSVFKKSIDFKYDYIFNSRIKFDISFIYTLPKFQMRG